MPRLILPFKVEIKGKATSTYDDGHIERRLTVLRDMEQTPQVVDEIAFLEKLKTKRANQPAI